MFSEGKERGRILVLSCQDDRKRIRQDEEGRARADEAVRVDVQGTEVKMKRVTVKRGRSDMSVRSER